jgi:Gene product 88
MSTTLTRSRDRKVTNAVSPSGNPLIANTFGLPAGHAYSCPGATKYCESICYAGKLEKIYKGVSAVLLRNFDALQNASRDEMVSMLSAMVAEFVAECEKRNARRMFRIHWDGDFWNPTYVTAWHKVIASHPDVQFWVYTRVPTAATYLHAQRLANLALYFSADRDNISIAKHLESQGILIAYVDDTFADGKAAFPKATRCPENNGALPLISAAGSACARCGLCVEGRKSVLFSATKR